MTTFDFLMRLAAAMVLGAALGLDREIKGAPVGVRTFALVAMGSAAYVMLSLNLGQTRISEATGTDDPSRIIQGLVGGIGFLGAGAVIGGMSAKKVRGIATGAAIWVSGAIGAACGLGLYWEALGATVLAILLLVTTEFVQYLAGERKKVVRKDGD